MLEQQRLWGFMVQLYGVRSERNWGIGDFTDLRKLIEIAAGLGAGVVGVNPLHATQGSPYSPSSRHALNVLYIDVEAVPGFRKSDKLPQAVAARCATPSWWTTRACGASSSKRWKSIFRKTQAARCEGARGDFPGVRGAAREARRRLAELAEASIRIRVLAR